MPLFAFLLVILAATLHALWNFATKKVSGNLSVIWIGLVLATIAIIPFLFFLSPEQIFVTKTWPFILATGLIHAVYFFAVAKAYEHGDISIIYPLARGSGIAGTAIIACLLLQEEISFAGTVGILLISLGTLLLGLTNIHQKRGIFFSLIVAVMIIGYSIVDKLGVGIIHPLGYIFGLVLLTTVFLAPYILINKRQELLSTMKNTKKYSLIIGLGSGGTYLIILFVFQMVQVSYVVATRELAVAIGALLGFIFLKEQFSAQKLLGIMGIVIGMILIRMA
jgi:drug/metabolite transporter (DMT)-like permease